MAPTSPALAVTITYAFDPPLDPESGTPREIGDAIAARTWADSAMTLWTPGRPELTGWSVVLPAHRRVSERVGEVEVASLVVFDDLLYGDGVWQLAEVKVTTIAELEARANTPDEPPDLVGIDEFCELLGGISRQRFHVLAKRPSFPSAYRRGIWLGAPARRWAAEHLAGKGGIAEEDRGPTAETTGEHVVVGRYAYEGHARRWLRRPETAHGPGPG